MCLIEKVTIKLQEVAKSGEESKWLKSVLLKLPFALDTLSLFYSEDCENTREIIQNFFLDLFPEPNESLHHFKSAFMSQVATRNTS